MPIGFIDPNTLSSDLVFVVQGATLYHFGVLSSEMHMTWMRYVCGRLKSDYRYSKDIVYNNFPWPKDVDSQSAQKIEDAAQNILTIRSQYSSSTLADLYDPHSMPSDLLKAHQELDRLVDKVYRTKAFTDEHERISFLFELYGEYVKSEVPVSKRKKKAVAEIEL